jgi:hypothetical protein
MPKFGVFGIMVNVIVKNLLNFNSIGVYLQTMFNGNLIEQEQLIKSILVFIEMALIIIFI